MLIDEYAVVVQNFAAVPVEFLREEPLARAEGVGRIDYYKVVFFFRGAHEFEAVLKVQRDARVVKFARREGQQFAADLDDHLVYIHHVDLLDRFVARELAHGAAVAAAYHEHAPDVRVRRHGHVDDHLVVDELVLFGEHHQPVEREEAPKLLRIEDVYLLEGAFAPEELFFHLYRKAYRRRVFFRIPKLHRYSPRFTVYSFFSSISCGPITRQPFSFA